VIAAQIDAVLEDIRVDAVKTGMLSSADIIATVAERMRHWRLDRLVVDPVMVAKSGDRLLREDAVQALVRQLLPLALVLTPNLPEAEVLVVDGGSKDGSWQELKGMRDEFSLRLLYSACGRALQMNAGAAASRGEMLLFLHADSRLPAGCDSAIASYLADPSAAGGCFRLSFPRPEWIYRVSDSLGNFAVDLFQIALGDHGIFCRRDAFLRVGGFPNLPLMEDAEFYRALKGEGLVRQVRSKITTSPRRYEELGRYRTTFFYFLLLVLYVVKVSPYRLARWHRHFTRERTPERLVVLANGIRVLR